MVFMWKVLILRLVIAIYRLDILMMQDSLHIPLEVWIVGWVGTYCGCYVSYRFWQLWIHVITFESDVCA